MNVSGNMNLALQNRQLQLERWKQNEASIEQSKSISSSKKSAGTTKVNGPKVKFSDTTLFLAACTNGDFDECTQLLQNNLVNINTTSSDGLTGLHEASIAGNAQMVEFLIKRNADVNCRDNEGWTPLHAAASLGQTKIVEILLENGADPTIVNCDNLLAFDLAKNDQVRALIANHLDGTDINLLRSQEERAIERDIDRWISTGIYDERCHPITKATVLHVLASKGHINLLKKMLDCPRLRQQIDLDARDNEGFTPLMAAAYWGHNEIVELLVEHGADIGAHSHQGYSFDDFITDTNFVASMKQLYSTSSKKRQRELANAPKERSTTSTLQECVTIRSAAKENDRLRYDQDVTFKISPFKSNNYNIVGGTSMVDLNPSPGSPSTPTTTVNISTFGGTLKTTTNSPLNLTPDKNNSSILSIASGASVSAGGKSPSQLSESETQRRAHAKKVRKTRRSTQGISAADVLAAKESNNGDSVATTTYDDDTMTTNTLSDNKGEQQLRANQRRPYDELLAENNKLLRQMQDFEDREKSLNQEWTRKERQLQRKISELEEEIKELEQWKHESQRLKDENTSLLRVISRLSK